ncbi:MAG: hypothetical protein C7B43_08275 [Sulfobacillus benefaciens]|uniref:HTH lacI-type domain-containing protein n=1 Tax=Sulfobacillus benefaciens TaxID=453960 RepID=A0A2T2X4B6_9FIRM|nr:MAG: hypothetical protein C7B43_08275 [Sulfobacillus benefaciens]
MSQTFRRARIGDVAKLAGVSTATVSYVLNNRGHFSTETIEKVREAARALNYSPNIRGRILVRGLSESIGILLPPLRKGQSPGIFAALMPGLITACQESNYQIIVLSGSGLDSSDYLQQVGLSGRADGLILLNGPDLAQNREILSRHRIPFVVFGDSHHDDFSYDVDLETAARMATMYLIGLGHRHITFLASDSLSWQTQRYRMAFEETMAEFHLTPEYPYRHSPEDCPNGTSLGDYQRAYDVLTQPNPPTALLVTTSYGAREVVRCAQDLGMHVPRRLSVMSLEPTWESQDTHPSLSTVEINLREAGYQLARMLISLIQGKHVTSQRVTPQLNIRQSTGVPAVFQTPTTDISEPVLKSGSAFALFSTQGHVEIHSKRHGIYSFDTRLLSVYQWRIQDEVLNPLAFDVRENVLIIRYAASQDGSTLVLKRHLTLYDDHLHDQWAWEYYGSPTSWALSVSMDADFTDIFELRGISKAEAGLKSKFFKDGQYVIEYMGIDKVTRQVRMAANRNPLEAQEGKWQWRIDPWEKQGELTVSIRWINPVKIVVSNAAVSTRRQSSLPSPPSLVFSFQDYPWNQVIRRAYQDYHQLLTDFGQGPVPMAGLPWFATFFGRDAIIASYQYLLWNPQIAVNTLYTLAQWQGQEEDPDHEEEAGKMVHEVRLGEMAQSGQVPFSRYYGSVDVTPLFLILLVETWKRTGDDQLIADLWPEAEKALSWLIASQDVHSGLFSFKNHGNQGLIIQSWKDSFDSMVYGSGEHAQPPLAVSEVQGYAYRALSLCAQYYLYIGREDKARELKNRATHLKRHFNKRYWVEEGSYYALALDSSGRPLDVLTSDTGQCLWSGIVRTSRIRALAHTIMTPQLFSGWGIRTLSSDAVTYDPYSYHRGSVWPHDTALIAKGLAQSGMWNEARVLARSLLAAASHFPYYRLPELFSGEHSTSVPYPYKGACSPQAWAAGAPLLLLQIILGMDIDATRHLITLRPEPEGSLGSFSIHNIPLTGEEFVSVEANSKGVVIDHVPDHWTVKKG